VGIGVGECVVFCAVRGVCCVRERVWGRGKGRGGVGIGEGGVVIREEIDEWEEVERPGSGTTSVDEV
jgi:hypothetical protein